MTKKTKARKSADEIRFYNRQLEAFAKIGKAISSGGYLEDILKLVVTVTAEAMDSKIVSLMLLDPEKNELVVRATQSVSEEYNRKPNMKLGEGIAGRVALTGQPIVVADVRKDRRYSNVQIAKHEKLCSLLSVPMSVKKRVIGVLNCYTSVSHKFSQAEINVLMAVAGQAAVVIENTELMLKSKIAEEKLEARKLIERAKEILSQSHGISGESAFRMLQKKSMDTRKSMKEIAEAIILADGIDKK